MATTYGILHLIRIECHEIDEGGWFSDEYDEIRIFKDGTCIYEKTSMEKGRHYAINQSHRFDNTVSIRVEEDDPESPNDDFGTHTFGKTNTGGEREAWYGGGDGRYRLVYTITVHYNPEKFFPRLNLVFKKAVVDLSYYSLPPSKIRTNIKTQLFGVLHTINGDYPLSANGEVIFNSAFGSKNYSFKELEAGHSCDIDMALTEQYEQFIPESQQMYKFSPVIPFRDQDRRDFPEVLPENGAEQTNTFELEIITRFPWRLYFQVELRFPRSLVVHQASNVNLFVGAVTHYLNKIKEMAQQELMNAPWDIDIIQTEIVPDLTGKSRIVVVTEAKGGSNEVFKDQLTGTTLSRQKLVNAIKSGLYPGYHIRVIGGVETPVSDPDSTVQNNLG